MYGRITVRMQLLRMTMDKIAGTSFVNTLDSTFLKRLERAANSCTDNSETAEAIWTTLTDLLASLLGFAVYLALLSGLHPTLLAVVIATTTAGWLVRRRTARWVYDHRDEQERYMGQIHYLRTTVTGRPFAKDLRIFGLRSWMDEVWERLMRLYRDYLNRLERHLLWNDVADLALTFARDGIAYALPDRAGAAPGDACLPVSAVLHRGERFLPSGWAAFWKRAPNCTGSHWSCPSCGRYWTGRNLSG